MRSSGRPSGVTAPATMQSPPIHVAPVQPVSKAQRPPAVAVAPSSTSSPIPAMVEADDPSGSASTSATQAGSPPAATHPSSAAPCVTTQPSDGSCQASSTPMRNQSTGVVPGPPRSWGTRVRKSPAARALS